MKAHTAICMTAVAAVLAVGGVPSAGATSAGGPVVDFRTSINCPPGPPGNCDLFHFSLTNNTSSPIDGLTIQWGDGPIEQFALQGLPSACGTKGVAPGAFVCWPIDVQPGASVTGTGMASGPLTQGSPFQTYWTPDNFATATGVDTPFFVSPDPEGAALVKRAYKWEESARLKVLEKSALWNQASGYLRQSSSLLSRAQGLVSSFPAPSRDLRKAIRENGLASGACRRHKRGSAVSHIRAASAAAKAGLKVLQVLGPR